MAGGSPVPGINGGEYTTTEHVDAHGKPYTLKQGDLGSHALKKRPTGVVWKSGGLANVSWYIAFNHGGGCTCHSRSRFSRASRLRGAAHARALP